MTTEDQFWTADEARAQTESLGGLRALEVYVARAIERQAVEGKRSFTWDYNDSLILGEDLPGEALEARLEHLEQLLKRKGYAYAHNAQRHSLTVKW